MSATKQTRPLSPHLSIYRPQITSVLSISHRITGIALGIGAPVLVFWLWSAAYSAECFSSLTSALGSPLGKILLLGWVFAFFYHLCNGIRHLYWDAGYGFDLASVTRSGIAVVTGALVLTATAAYIALSNTGALQ